MQHTIRLPTQPSDDGRDRLFGEAVYGVGGDVGVGGEGDTITYRDIMLLEHTVSSEEIWELTAPVVDKMATEVAAKIKELNGDKSEIGRAHV